MTSWDRKKTEEELFLQVFEYEISWVFDYRECNCPIYRRSEDLQMIVPS